MLSGDIPSELGVLSNLGETTSRMCLSFGPTTRLLMSHCFEESLSLHNLLLEGSIPTELGNFEAMSKFMCTLSGLVTIY